ncbi:unnamed protein product [Rhizophagus irregularis]|nr:unnamed protein product [Rhizophagus irregularis]
MYNNYARDPNKEVALKCLRNSQYSIDFLIIEANKYLTNNEGFHKLYGISQNPDTNDYILVQNNSINITNCISINEKIDNFIQEMQLKMDKYIDTVFEWIPYNQFNETNKETCKNDSITVYSAIWKDGPLQYNNEYNNFTRDSNKKVALKCFCNLQYSIDFLINEAKKYSRVFHILYGISQNPITNNYILVQNNFINITNWISGNEIIDNIIQEMQFKIKYYPNVVFEWIPYNQFDEIKEIGKNGSITVYSAIWMDGPLCYNYNCTDSYTTSYTRNPNKEVTLKYLHNSQNAIDFVINKVENYLTNIYNGSIFVVYGISQNPDTNDYILSNVLFEWIPYNQIYEIKEIGKNGSITAYSAIWKDGPLLYSNYGRDSNKEVVLKCLHNSHSTIDFVISEAEKYLINTYGYKDIYIIYGISQNPDTNDYIFVLSNFIWESGYKKIDDFIQKMQLKMKESSYKDNLFEWIPYNQLNEIKEIGKNGSITIYSAIWKDGPLYYNKDKEYSNYSRVSNKAVALKYLYNSQNTIEFVINKVVEYSKSTFGIRDFVIYGISQNPETNDYILVLNNYIWESGNEKIDEFIQEMHIKMMGAYENTVFEWIPYNQLNEIKEIDKSSFISIYSAIWKDGPLYRNKNCRNYTRDSNLEVALRCLHGSQNTIEIVRNEAEKYLINEFSKEIFDIYGISQNPNTNDYVLVLNNFMSVSENKKIDNFIQEINFNTNIIFEWIPYNRLNEIKKVNSVFEWVPYDQLNEIKEIGKNTSILIYSAIWKDGPLYYDDQNSIDYTRDPNKEVSLKYLQNTQNSVESLIKEAKKYLTKNGAFMLLYGISQNPNTNDYILIQNNYLNLANWISGNEKIDDFIQEMQLKLDGYEDIVFEWVPYNQFNNINEIGKGGFAIVYSANWKDGPLEYVADEKTYKRNDPNKVIALKCLRNSQNITNKFLNEV